MKGYSFYTFLILFFTFLIIILLALPQYQNWKITAIRLTDAKKELDNKNVYYAKIEETAKELKGYEASLLKINNAIPKNANLAELLNYIQKVAGQTELSFEKIGSIEFTKKPKSELTETRIEITLKGNYNGFKKFLSMLERSARLIKVESINFLFPPEKPNEDENKKTAQEKKTEAQKKKITEQVTPLFDFVLKIKVYSEAKKEN